jgi:acylphosphatase
MVAEIEAVRVRVTGRVQGVNFRAWTRSEAQALGLAGWVRNEADGSVTALIAGERAAVARMLERLREGPRFAAVADIRAERAEAPQEQGFQIRR